jgi:hypothetical protein
MRETRLQVFQHLVVQSVHHDWCDVAIGVTDRSGRVDHITFTFSDPFAACDQRDRLLRWQAAQRPLTYVRGGPQAVLLDDEESFYGSFDAEFGR